MTIRIDVLGAPRCFVDDRELADLPAQRTRFAILVYLAVERETARDDVASVFWPERRDERARHALSQSIYELKRALGDGWLETQSGRLVVNDNVILDTSEFTSLTANGRLADALVMYRGTFLKGFFLSNCKDFETWVDRQRGQYERAHRKARREFVDLLSAGGQMAEAIDAARKWVEVDQLEDEANHRLIELLSVSGRRAEALTAYGTYEERLKAELQIEPLDHTKDLIKALRESPAVSTALSSSAQSPPASTVSARPGGAVTPALESALALKIRRRRLRRRIGVVAGAIATALALILDLVPIATSEFKAGWRWPPWNVASSTDLDTTRFIIIPFEYDKNVSERLHEEQLLRNALGRWKGIEVVDHFQVQEALDRLDGSIDTRGIINTAREMGAGRVVRGSVTRLGDSLLVNGILYDANRRLAIANRTVQLPMRLKGVGDTFLLLADALLFRNESVGKAASTTPATTSWPATSAFAQAQLSIREWNLVRADSHLVAATRHDPDYAEAYLWLAQIRSWRRLGVAEWRYAADNAHARRATMPDRERALTEAVFALADERYPEACAIYEKLANAEQRDFTAWYAWADCLHRDRAVRRDSKSPTGYSFRTSRHQAIEALRHAFTLMPSVHRAFAVEAYQHPRHLLHTSASDLRAGDLIAPDTGRFFAYPSWNADTIAFYPKPFADLPGAMPWARAHNIDRALAEQRKLFFEIAKGWAAAYPEDSDAKYAVAIGLELLGDNSAIDTLRAARLIAKNKHQAFRYASAEVWLAIKFAIPFDSVALRRAGLLADSLLDNPEVPSAVDLGTLASIAVLRGRGHQAAAYMQRHPMLISSELDMAYAREAQILLTYAAVGGPPDSLRAASERLKYSAEHGPTSDATEWRRSWQRSAALSLPSYSIVSPADQNAVDSRTLRLVLAAHRRDTAFVRQWQSQILAMRTGYPAQDLTIDGVYLEAWSIAQTFGPASAIQWLDPSLRALRWTQPQIMADVVRAGTLVRSMVLRAELARAVGDYRAAQLWAQSAAILWQGSDPYLQPTIKRLRDLRNSPVASNR